MSILGVAVYRFCQIIIWLILARAIMSWFIRVPSGTLYSIYSGLCQLTEIIIGPCRNMLNRMGMQSGPIDFAPMVAILLIWLIQSLALSIL